MAGKPLRIIFLQPPQRDGSSLIDAEGKLRLEDNLAIGPEGLSKTCTIQFSSIKRGHILGQGRQGKVRKAQIPSGETLALKELQVWAEPGTLAATKKVLRQEVSSVLSPIDHPNVIKSLNAYFVESCLFVLMEYMNCGTLDSLLSNVKYVPELHLAGIISQVTAGLGCLHSLSMIHRDLKPSNILLNRDGLVKIADFGCAKTITSTDLIAETVTGTYVYHSPERARGQPHTGASDVWSLGVVTAQAALGVFPIFPQDYLDSQENPFEKKPVPFGISMAIIDGFAVVDFDKLVPKLKTLLHRDVTASADLRSFVAATMAQSEADRPSCSSLRSHPFLQQGSEKLLQAWLEEVKQREFLFAQSQSAAKKT
eukprot:RCo019685